jgi:hypothetical protein
VVESTSLENWQGFTPFESSNLSPSAILGGKCYGSTADSNPAGLGSIPRSPAIIPSSSVVEQLTVNQLVASSNLAS